MELQEYIGKITQEFSHKNIRVKAEKLIKKNHNT